MKKLFLIFTVLILTIPSVSNAADTPMIGNSEPDFSSSIDEKTVVKEERATARSAEKEETGEKEEIVPEEEIETKASKEKSSGIENALKGASMAAAGIGGAKFLSAKSEEKADTKAETDMKAYLSGFRCNYGAQSVKGGEKEITLPGANSLISLYTEYKTLASQLKSKKEALGIQPGIESEVILDKAKNGLYDDEGTEKSSSTYASISRALTDTNGEDAAKLNAQKAETAKKKKTGAIIGIAGLAVGAVAPHSDKIVGALGNLGGDNSKNNDNSSESSGLLNKGLGALSNGALDSGTESEIINDASGNDATGTEINVNPDNGFSSFGN